MSTQQQVGKPAQAGKGSRPRPVRGSTYRDNYAAIQWRKTKPQKPNDKLSEGERQ
jgi:uncharacterized protein YfaQ (DUF2300 family)